MVRLLSEGKMNITKTTICYQCKFFHNEEPTGPRKDVWYNHVCKASPLPIDMNPVTGEMQARTCNDLGQVIHTNRTFEFCRNINKGDCELFEPKSQSDENGQSRITG